jgi:hypothetical protein
VALTGASLVLVAGLAGLAANAVPQSPQNLDAAGFGAPHFGHSMDSALPHCEQKRFPSGFCVPHSGQNMAKLIPGAAFTYH